jgi:transketolase
MLIGKTIKGKGVSFIENKNGWHGKTLNKEECDRALRELGEIDKSIRGEISPPEDLRPKEQTPQITTQRIDYPADKSVSTRKAYGNGLVMIIPQFPNVISLDGEVSNSTYAEILEEAYPDHFFEMYIAEQNMVGAALGFSCRGKIPFVSTFSAFMSRAFDQIRMSQYSNPNIKFVGSHAGVSIGEDGPSQMGLEDIAMFRTILNSVVLYPCDAVSTEKLVEESAKHHGLVYIRTTRKETPVIYNPDEEFPIGGSKLLRKSNRDRITVVAAGITVFEALNAYEELKKEGILICVIDLYSIKPIDINALQEASDITEAFITVEDHYAEGGIGEAVKSALATSSVPVYSLAVRKKPKSGKPQELIDYEEISQKAIIEKVKELL